MSRTAKKTVDAIDADTLLGSTALVRAAIWQNGQRQVAAIVTDATTDAALLPEGAIALVSLTAFPPGAASRMMRDVPLYPAACDESALPAAWIKR
ncbi:hypothetical protein R69746_05647 [Paraburkholderia aspalathi]|jgi:hypothetical protein|uniref:hypothetical protein n=1 Tax=Paraburkholderia aspalathi TaxID=1324617 RepID=UPI00190DE076|nr:hypothetical protein [Paraburkholderia aspalathi]MBK3841730.1 hypothetical protein [Paraburkholderia aspalathi]CAE6811633.1 hypothetical protein R69746_05647 [Paraburkholderia aspalathi]